MTDTDKGEFHLPGSSGGHAGDTKPALHPSLPFLLLLFTMLLLLLLYYILYYRYINILLYSAILLKQDHACFPELGKLLTLCVCHLLPELYILLFLLSSSHPELWVQNCC